MCVGSIFSPWDAHLTSLLVWGAHTLLYHLFDGHPLAGASERKPAVGIRSSSVGGGVLSRGFQCIVSFLRITVTPPTVLWMITHAHVHTGMLWHMRTHALTPSRTEHMFSPIRGLLSPPSPAHSDVSLSEHGLVLAHRQVRTLHPRST